jgi:hypothetical protein
MSPSFRNALAAFGVVGLFWASAAARGAAPPDAGPRAKGPAPLREVRRVGSLNFYHNDPTVLAFSPSGERLVTKCYRGLVRSWEVPSGKKCLEIDEGRESGRGGIAVTPRDELLSAAKATIRVRDLHSGRLLARLVAPGNEEEFETLYVTSNGRLAVASTAFEGHLWEVPSRKYLGPIKALIHRFGCHAVHPSRPLLLLALPGSDTVELWDLQTRKKSKVFVPLAGARWKAVAWSLDGKLVALSQRKKDLVLLWDLERGKEHGRFSTTPGAEGSGPDTLSFDPRGKVLATLSVECRLWDVATCRPLLPGGAVGHAWHCAFSADGDYLALTGRSGTVDLYRLGKDTRYKLVGAPRRPVTWIAPPRQGAGLPSGVRALPFGASTHPRPPFAALPRRPPAPRSHCRCSIPPRIGHSPQMGAGSPPPRIGPSPCWTARLAGR